MTENKNKVVDVQGLTTRKIFGRTVFDQLKEDGCTELMFLHGDENFQAIADGLGMNVYLTQKNGDISLYTWNRVLTDYLEYVEYQCIGDEDDIHYIPMGIDEYIKKNFKLYSPKVMEG